MPSGGHDNLFFDTRRARAVMVGQNVSSANTMPA
jgi:hypothetical protein